MALIDLVKEGKIEEACLISDSASSAIVSIAISLKRIADALDRPSNKYGESIFEAIATVMRENQS